MNQELMEKAIRSAADMHHLLPRYDVDELAIFLYRSYMEITAQAKADRQRLNRSPTMTGKHINMVPTSTGKCKVIPFPTRKRA